LFLSTNELVTQNSSFIILKRKSFVNCFFAIFSKKIKKYEKVFFICFFVEWKAEKYFTIRSF